MCRVLYKPSIKHEVGERIITMANNIILKRVEQLKYALRNSVDDETYKQILEDYDIVVRNKKTNQTGYVIYHPKKPKFVQFIVPSESNKHYDIHMNQFNKHYDVLLKYKARKQFISVFVTCVICRYKEYDENEVFSYIGQPYTCHDCIESFEYI